MKNFDGIILGCGAAGAMCAISSKVKSLAVIDVATRPAKKLLVTGNGRCNLTNTNVNSSFYNTNIDRYLKRFDNKQTLRFFNSLGLETYADDEGRVYPISNSAKSVVDVISQKLNDENLFLGQKIVSVRKEKEFFVVETDKEVFKAKKLVVTTGGNSFSLLGNLGVKYAKFTPSLVSLKAKNTRELNGIKLSDVKVTATNKFGSVIEIGEVLFKEEGLSGIVIFNISTLFARNNDFSGSVSIDLLPKLSKKEIFEWLIERKKLDVFGDKFFVGMFQNAVANEIFKQAKINTNKNVKEFSDQEIDGMVNIIKNLHFEVFGCYENNQVFSGGVRLDDLTENLESKQIKNLFFCGEIVNVDGVCGGYNLQWAWTSGHIVGESLWLRLNKYLFQ